MTQNMLPDYIGSTFSVSYEASCLFIWIFLVLEYIKNQNAADILKIEHHFSPFFTRARNLLSPTHQIRSTRIKVIILSILLGFLEMLLLSILVILWYFCFPVEKVWLSGVTVNLMSHGGPHCSHYISSFLCLLHFSRITISIPVLH